MLIGEIVDPLSIHVDEFSTGNLYDSVERKLENESERPGLEFELQLPCHFETVTTQLT